MVWLFGPESLNIGYLDPLGWVYFGHGPDREMLRCIHSVTRLEAWHHDAALWGFRPVKFCLFMYIYIYIYIHM